MAKPPESNWRISNGDPEEDYIELPSYCRRMGASDDMTEAFAPPPPPAASGRPGPLIFILLVLVAAGLFAAASWLL